MPDYTSFSDVRWYDNCYEIDKVVITDGVTNIGAWAFGCCDYVTSAIIPNSVTSIGDYAFYGCNYLGYDTTIPNSVTSIGNYAFGDCRSLGVYTIVTIPSSVTSIGEYAFHHCSGLTSITIPNSLTNIGKGAFYRCTGITSITVEKGNTKYDSRDNCNAIIETSSNKLILGCKNTVIPNSVTSIGEVAFDDCSGLTSIIIPNSVTSIGERAFEGCSGLTSVTIPNSVTSIGERAFEGCSGLTSVTIPNSVTSIGLGAFHGCSGLTSIEIPNSVTSIGNYAFDDCYSLTSVEIPNSVTSIGNFAFSSCKALSSITFKGSTPPTFGKDVFKYVDKSILVYVPANSGETYKNALAGYGFSNIKEFTSISLNDNSSAYTRNTQIDNADVSYTRDFSKYWEPLYIPFSLKYEDWKDDFEIAYINAVHQYDTNDNGDIDKTVLEFVKIKSGSTYPNTPYIIRAKEKGKKTLYAENVTLYESDVNQIKCSTTAQEFIFTGNYKKVSTMDLMAYYTNKYTMHLGDINYINLITGVGAYRWYMEIKERESVYGINNNNTAKEISIRVVGEETTGIANIQHTSPNTQTYDLNGRRVNENNLKPGMYVKNGRKFVIK